MNPWDDQLRRLLQSAAAAPKPPSSAALFALESRVLGQWRASLREDAGEFFVAWLRRAAIFGCVLAMASVVWTFHARDNSRGGVMAVADSAMSMGVEP
jgi:hypothetical protein